jgi:hypothetical protein
MSKTLLGPLLSSANGTDQFLNFQIRQINSFRDTTLCQLSDINDTNRTYQILNEKRIIHLLLLHHHCAHYRPLHYQRVLYHLLLHRPSNTSISSFLRQYHHCRQTLTSTPSLPTISVLFFYTIVVDKTTYCYIITADTTTFFYTLLLTPSSPFSPSLPTTSLFFIHHHC